MFAPKSLKRKNLRNLALGGIKPPAPSTDGTTAHETSHGDAEADANELSVEFDLNFKLEDLKAENIIVLKDLGHTNTASLSKVCHIATKTLMIRKVCTSKSLRPHDLRTLAY
jgi:mitogen-activated protein kinase kinase